MCGRRGVKNSWKRFADKSMVKLLGNKALEREVLVTVLIQNAWTCVYCKDGRGNINSYFGTDSPNIVDYFSSSEPGPLVST